MSTLSCRLDPDSELWLRKSEKNYRAVIWGFPSTEVIWPVLSSRYRVRSGRRATRRLRVRCRCAMWPRGSSRVCRVTLPMRTRPFPSEPMGFWLRGNEGFLGMTKHYMYYVHPSRIRCSPLLYFFILDTNQPTETFISKHLFPIGE